MAASTSLTSRRGLGGFAALAGGALMIISVFLPWLSSGGADKSGWTLYTNLKDVGSNGFFEQHFYSEGFSPFFSGLSILIAGGLLALIGLAMFMSLSGGAFRLPAAGQFALAVLAVLIAIVGVTNLASLYSTGPGAGLLDPAYGLFILTGGAVVGFLGGVLGSLGDGRS